MRFFAPPSLLLPVRRFDPGFVFADGVGGGVCEAEEVAADDEDAEDEDEEDAPLPMSGAHV